MVIFDDENDNKFFTFILYLYLLVLFTIITSDDCLIPIEFYLRTTFQNTLRNEDGIWTGDPVPGTYCNRNIYDCDKR